MAAGFRRGVPTPAGRLPSIVRRAPLIKVEKGTLPIYNRC
jgi:hypothetical protein